MTSSGRQRILCLGVLLALAACGQAPSAPTGGETAGPVPAATATRPASPSPRSASPACPSPRTVSPADPVEQSAFADRLRGKGFTVERVAEASQRFLCIYGAILRLSGGGLAEPVHLQAYVYDDPALAAANAARVQPDTSVRWTEPDGREMTGRFAWVAPPHFFQEGRVLVLYAGNDQAVLAALTELLGPQFAGR